MSHKDYIYIYICMYVYCGMPTEKVSEFLDYEIKPVMQKGKSYIRDSGHFLEKIKNISTLPENAILVTADVVGSYPSIPIKLA